MSLATKARYLRYKGSGVPWIGDLPSHWQIRRTKYAVDPLRQKTNNIPEDPFYVGMENVESWTGRLLPAEQAAEPEGVVGTFQSGDVLFGKLRPYLAKALRAERDGYCSTELLALGPKSVASGFLLYWMLNSDFVREVDGSTYGSKMPRANWEFIGNLPIAIPPLEEQQAITAFLDRETARIDTLIDQKRRLMALLKEQRQVLITRTVTKGLDANAKLMDSGVPWLGTIPVSWQVVPLKRAVTFQRGHDLPADEREDGEVPVVTSAGISSTHSVARAKGPGLVTGRYGTIGEFTLVSTDYWPLNTTLYSIDTRNNHVRFLWYMLHNLSDLFILNAQKSAVPGVDRNDLHPVLTAVPPLHDQDNIAAYLDERLAQIDNVVLKNEVAINRLVEVRQAMIAAVVTGKVKVSG